MKSLLGPMALVLAAVLGLSQSAVAQFSNFGTHPAPNAEETGQLMPPEGFACAETSPPLVFTKEDFEQGFSRVYNFPDITECDGSGWHRSGQLRLTYSPAPRGHMHAEMRYTTRYDCQEEDGSFVEKGFAWSGQLFLLDEDPEGVFPAGGFEELFAKASTFQRGGCSNDTEAEPVADLQIRLGLLYWDRQIGAYIRRPFFEFRGDFADTFGPVQEPPGDVRLVVDGCAHISSGIDAVLTAHGEPAGGSYSWSATPSSVLSVDGDDATAVTTAGAAGRGTVTVRYQDPEGRERSSQIEGSVVELESVNEGQPLPKLGLLDAKGKPTSKIVSVPVQMQPAGAGDLLDFKPEDPGIVTSQGDGVRLHLQPRREGTTVIQPRTVCGAAVGPALPVQVVPCDDEVLAQLEREDQLAKEQHRNILEEIGKIRGSKELQEAENKTAEAARDLLVKGGLLIVGTLGGLKGADAWAATGATYLGHVDAANSLVNDALSGNFTKTVDSGAQLIVEAGGSAFQQFTVDAYQAVVAADRFGVLLGTLVGRNEQLQWLSQQQEKYGREIEDVARRKLLCKATKDEPKPGPGPKPKRDPTPDPKPDPKPQRVPHPPPKTIDVPPDEPPPATEPPGQEPTSPAIRVGLPYDQAKCACGETRELPADPQGFAVLREGMGILDRCVTTFRDGPLAQLGKAAEQGRAVFVALEVAAKTGGEAWISAATAAKPRLEALRQQLQSSAESAREFTAEMETCAGKPTALEFGMYSPEAASQQPPLLDVKRP